ncbi:MAG: hypothetical protein HYX80_06025 [Chloroflexi bacterium]|nr:hypothetical protein [Chloroflexota bacterium]
MYVQAHSITLRQGDILEKVWFTPATFHKVTDGQFTVPPATFRNAHLVVVSHCCELTWYVNEQQREVPRRPYVLVAPLSFRMPFVRTTKEYEMLTENGLNRPDNDPVQYFYYDIAPSIGQEAVVDFSSMTPIRSGLLRELGLTKLLELDVKHRHLFRTKLHEYFARIPEEEWEEVKTLFPDTAQ